MAPRNAVLGKDGNKLKLRCCYNIALVRLLYVAIPEKSRVYISSENCWYIDDQYETVVKQLLEKLRFIISSEEDEPPASLDEFAVLGLLPSAPMEVCEAAYKALCKVHHPDTGGDPEKMKNINVAWLKIKATKGIK